MAAGREYSPNMVLPGKECPRQESIEQVAGATVTCLLRAVPATVPGVAFLSRGSLQNWPRPALEIWAGQEAAAQQALYHRAKCNTAARRGMYDAAMEMDRSG